MCNKLQEPSGAGEQDVLSRQARKATIEKFQLTFGKKNGREYTAGYQGNLMNLPVTEGPLETTKSVVDDNP